MRIEHSNSSAASVMVRDEEGGETRWFDGADAMISLVFVICFFLSGLNGCGGREWISGISKSLFRWIYSTGYCDFGISIDCRELWGL